VKSESPFVIKNVTICVRTRCCLFVDLVLFFLFNALVFFVEKIGDINLNDITIFCFLNCIFKCTNGFSVLKNLWSTQII
jgi:hypothetical protein